MELETGVSDAIFQPLLNALAEEQQKKRKKFHVCFPGESQFETFLIPPTNLKAYLQLVSLNANYQIALLHSSLSSGPFFPTIQSIPENLLKVYTFIVSN